MKFLNNVEVEEKTSSTKYTQSSDDGLTLATKSYVDAGDLLELPLIQHTETPPVNCDLLIVAGGLL